MWLARCTGTVLLVTALAACVAGQQPAATAADAERLFVLINESRTARKLPPLARSAALDKDARSHAVTLAATGKLRHRSSREFRRLGVEWTRVAENIGTAAGPDEMHRAVMASRLHRENLLGPYTLVGIGVARDRRGRLWATEVFVAQ